MTTPAVERLLREHLAERAAEDAAHAVTRGSRGRSDPGPAFALSALWDVVTGIAAEPSRQDGWLADPRRLAVFEAMLATRGALRSGRLKAAADGGPLRRHVGHAVVEVRSGTGSIPPVLVVTGLGTRSVSFAMVIAGDEIHRIALPPPTEGCTQTFLPQAEPTALRFAELFGDPEADIVLL